MITHVLATAAEGRLCPIPPHEGAAVGSAILKCEPGKIYRLTWSTFTRKRVAGGDLILVNAKTLAIPRPGDRKVTPEEASVGLDVRVTSDGTIEPKAAELEASAPAKTPRKDG